MPLICCTMITVLICSLELPETCGLCGFTLRKLWLALCFCNGWDSSPGDQGRRPVLSASATHRHYKLAACRLHCSAGCPVVQQDSVGSHPRHSKFPPDRWPWMVPFLFPSLPVPPSGLCPQRSHFLKWMYFSEKCAPLKSDLAFMNAALSVDFSTSWYCRLVMEKCELLSLCCQMKNMWEELCISQASFTEHVLVYVCVCVCVQRTVPELSACLYRDLVKLLIEYCALVYQAES